MLIGQYDRNDRTSIFSYSKLLVNHSLRDFTVDAAEHNGKGGLGQLVEELFFGYDVNSKAEADFAAAGVELKCTPLKLNRQDELAIKERLVCGMINYREDWDKSFEESHFYKKCLVMLILFYLHRGSVPRLDLKFLFTVLWQLPEKDLLIMRHDYEIISDKKLFHVRPKGRNAADLTTNPHGGRVRKYCYWFNSEYVTNLINEQK